MLNGEEAASANLTLLIDLMKNTKTLSSDLCTQIFQTCQAIGSRYKSALAEKREDLVSYESSNAMCRTLIDMIDGNKMSEEQQALLNQRLEEMIKVEARLLNTDQTVQDIAKVVKRQELHVSYLLSFLVQKKFFHSATILIRILCLFTLSYEESQSLPFCFRAPR